MIHYLSDLHVGNILEYKNKQIKIYPYKVLVEETEHSIDPEELMNLWKSGIKIPKQCTFKRYEIFPRPVQVTEISGDARTIKLKDVAETKENQFFITNKQSLYDYIKERDYDYALKELLIPYYLTEEKLLNTYYKIRQLDRQERETRYLSKKNKKK